MHVVVFLGSKGGEGGSKRKSSAIEDGRKVREAAGSNDNLSK